MYVTPTRIYITADRSRVVPEDDPAAALLLAAAGDGIPDDEAKRLGLLAPPTSKAAPEPAAPEPDAKQVRQAEVEDKAVKSPAAAKEDAAEPVAVGRAAHPPAKRKDT